MPSQPKKSTSDRSLPTAKLSITPSATDAMKAPASEPMPPMTMTANTTAPTDSAIDGSVTRKAPPMTPASAASAVPPPNTSIITRGTLWPSDSTASGCVSEAWMTSPIRVRVSTSHTATSINTATPMPKARKDGNWVQMAPAVVLQISGGIPQLKPSDVGRSTIVNKGPRSDSGGWKFRGWRPQTSCTISRMM